MIRQAVTGEANYRVREALGDLPSFVGQAPHHRVVAAHEVKHELATERCDERLRLPEPLAENPCPAVGGPVSGAE